MEIYFWLIAGLAVGCGLLAHKYFDTYSAVFAGTLAVFVVCYVAEYELAAEYNRSLRTLLHISPPEGFLKYLIHIIGQQFLFYWIGTVAAAPGYALYLHRQKAS